MRARERQIRRLREEAGYGLNAFARSVGVDPSHLSRIERQQARPSPEVLKRIADGLGVAIKEIASHEEEKQ
ncbi:helix-turn-helix domain-containing protein [Streptomyces sp. NPDC127040]|uniref:helix-turn-helix domain-containing protein n=1 Tax=Streptomyces sp. NPDC127040 TaxID=3347116 RepID=UPI00364F7D52